MITPNDQFIVEVWADLGAVPDDLPTREFAARLCKELLDDRAIMLALCTDLLAKAGASHAGHPAPPHEARLDIFTELATTSGDAP